MYSSSLSLGSLSGDLEDDAESDVDVTDDVDEVEDVDGVGGDGGADRCTWLGLLGLWANPPRLHHSSGGIHAILTPLGGPCDSEDCELLANSLR